MNRIRKPNGHKARTVSLPNHPAWYHCPACGKRTYESRKDARRIARRMVTGPHASAYECEIGSGRWHTGRLAPAVVYGRTTRHELYDHRSAA